MHWHWHWQWPGRKFNAEEMLKNARRYSAAAESVEKFRRRRKIEEENEHGVTRQRNERAEDACVRVRARERERGARRRER